MVRLCCLDYKRHAQRKNTVRSVNLEHMLLTFKNSLLKLHFAGNYLPENINRFRNYSVHVLLNSEYPTMNLTLHHTF